MKLNRLKEFKKNSPEYIGITLIFWGLFIVVILASLFRFLGWGFYSKTIEPKNYNYWINLFGNFILKFIEGIFIICALTRLKLWKGAIISFIYVLIINIVDNKIFTNIADFVYIIIIPFIFVRHKKFIYTQIGKIATFVTLLLIYQFSMSFGIYEMQISEFVKYDFVFMLASIIPYKLFIIWLYLFFRRKYICKKKQTQ